MSEVQPVVFSHIAICCSNLERSEQFYTKALGLVLDKYADVGPAFETLTELPGIKGRAGFFWCGATRVELLEYETPAAIGSQERRPMNQLGVTHMGLVVADLAAVTDLIEQYGGRVLAETRIAGPQGAMVFGTDPDGVRLELWEKTT